MKTFREFISECYFLLSEAPKPPDYNYEEAFVRLYNYLTGSEDKKNQIGKQMRSLIQRSAGDSAEAADATNDIVSIISREVAKAERDPKHPLHFNNIPDIGFNRGGKTSEHQSAYYEKLNGQKYTFLNLIGSKSGRSMGAKGLIAVRAGSEKTPLSPRGAEVYGKSSDTSKADVLFKDNSGEVLHTSSLKDVGGSVFASSGPEETKGNLLMGMYASLDARLEKNEINQNEYNELVEKGTQLASELALKMTTKGLSKEEEKGIIDPEIDSRGLFRTMGDFEDSFPGVSEYVAKEQITGKGKYGQGVDSVLKTNKGGELIEFPEFLSTFVKQRFRTSKHGEKGNVTQSADALKVDKDVERPGPDREAYSRLTQSRFERNLKTKIAGFEPEIQDAIVKLDKNSDNFARDFADYEAQDTSLKRLKSFDQFQQDAQSSVVQAQQAQQSAQKKLDNAIAKSKESEIPIDPDTGEPIPARFRATAIQNMAADPTSRTAKINNARREKSQSIITKAQSEYDNAAASYQETQSTLDAIQQNKQPQQQTPPSEQQPQQSAAPTTPSEPTQPQQQTQPPQQTPAQEQQPQQQPEPSGPKTAAQQAAELGLTGDGHGRWYDNKGNVAAETEGDILKRTAPLKPKPKNTGTAERMDAAGKKLGLPDS